MIPLLVCTGVCRRSAEPLHCGWSGDDYEYPRSIARFPLTCLIHDLKLRSTKQVRDTNDLKQQQQQTQILHEKVFTHMR